MTLLCSESVRSSRYYVPVTVLCRVTTLQTMWNSPTVRGNPPRHSVLGVTHIMPVLVLLSVVGVGMQQCMNRNHIFNTEQTLLNTCMDANMQLTINSFRQLFPDTIFSLTFPTFSKIPDISLTAVKFPDIFQFSRQVGSPWWYHRTTALYYRVVQKWGYFLTAHA